ncbi:MAG TPA: site-2 protease family protein [Saprospiraceae bacterium]|nr:site-2 protease family protein [Saprospiraceae bacterium]
MSIFEKGSLYVGTYFDIPVKIHWTFGYIIFYIIYTSHQDNMGVIGALWFGVFMMSLFLCVILHEYGHALAARRYGVKTADIILTPLGGIARLLKMPDKPLQELIVAIAGPMVNVVIAALLYLLLAFGMGVNPLGIDVENAYDFKDNPALLLSMIMLTNIVLVVFNLLPVFPMDGGRVLRSLIAMRVSKVKATLIAARIGQVFSAVFVVYGIYEGNFILALIGLFIFQGAYAEYRFTKAENVMQTTTIGDLGHKEYDSLQDNDLIINCKELIKYSNQQFFPVYSGNHVMGSISRETIAEAEDSLFYQPISILPMKPVFILPADTPWMICYQKFSQDLSDIILVSEEDQSTVLLDKWTFYEQMEQKKLIKSS